MNLIRRQKKQVGGRRNDVSAAVCAVALILVSLIQSCAPAGVTKTSSDGVFPVTATRCLPHSLELDSTSSHYARIRWNPGCAETRMLQGFNIYRSDTPLAERLIGGQPVPAVLPFNGELYPGDTANIPTRETYELANLPNGRRHYIQVRAVYDDQSLSPPTNEIEIICYPQGEMHLDVSYSGDRSGFCFIRDSYCRTDDLDNDLYYYAKDGKDYLCSPERISPVNRTTKLSLAGRGSNFDGVFDTEEAWYPAEKIEVKTGDICLVQTHDGDSAALRIIRFEGVAEQRSVILNYLYHPHLPR